MNLTIFWAALAVVGVVVEVFTFSFVLIYFSIGAVVALIVDLAGFGLGWQVAAFAVVSVGLLLATRPYILRHVQPKTRASNVDMMVGRKAIVTIPVSNDESTGQVRIGTEFWTARSLDDEVEIPAGAKVEVVEVAGVTARVRPVSDAAGEPAF